MEPKPKPVRDLSDSIPVKISIGDGRYVDAEEVMRLFSFPRAETPEELAKIKAKNVSCSRKCEQTTEPMRGFLRAQGLDEWSI